MQVSQRHAYINTNELSLYKHPAKKLEKCGFEDGYSLPEIQNRRNIAKSI